MSEHEKKPSRAAGFFKGKGFYMVLAVCMVAVGGIAAATFLDTLTGLEVGQTMQTTTTAAVKTATTTVAATTMPVTTSDRAVAATTAEALTKTTAAETPAASDLFVLPAGNEVLQPFSAEPTYSETMNDYRVHTGVDFVAEQSQPVKAAAAGTVTKTATDWLWGDMITIRHAGDITSVYCGTTASVKEGDTVAAGDVIGTLSGIPCESLMAPHLHFEVYQGETAIDAIGVLDAGVRYNEGAEE